MTNFRNYRSLELDLPPQVTIFQGDNAQGKSNLLEAVYLLATSRSHRTASEKELIHWEAAREGWPFSRLRAEVQGARGGLKIEIAFQAQPRVEAEAETPALRLTKRLWINGLPRRASELVGQVKVVLFSSLDIELVAGSPALRRRFLDGTSCQVDARYLRALQRYQRVLLQRNHLLRLIQEDKAVADQLSFWDDELTAVGSYITFQRQRLVADLKGRARRLHRELTGGDEELEVSYLCSLGKEFAREEEAQVTFREALAARRRREIALGMT
ncbi:MAG: DNA replication and repair protein RecF, partial [Chloroflexota bacterium]|nr:DNA replication and repair protein RecF [Chloroflexota bacterium]